jgi:hypothetical protein
VCGEATHLNIREEHPIFASGAGYYARVTRKNGESALILRVQGTRKMSSLNRKMYKWDAP